MFMKESKTAAVCQIIQNEQIKSVYQPIISLTDGKVLGYEALARITRSEPDVSIEEMFVLAEQCGRAAGAGISVPEKDHGRDREGKLSDCH